MRKQQVINIQAFLTYFITDQLGRSTRPRTVPMRSLIEHFLVWMSSIWGNQTVPYHDIANVLQNWTASSQAIVKGTSLNIDRGLRVGSGSTTPTISDYKLQTPYAEGAGAGQLNHSQTSVTLPATSEPEASFVVTRSFTNAYASAQTIREIAIYAAQGATGFSVCLSRDVISDVVLDPTKTFNLTATLKVTV